MFKNKKSHHEQELTISNKEFDAIKHNALIIDVRDTNEYQVLRKIDNVRHELNIINVPYLQLINTPSKYITNKNTTIITICNAGNRSTAAAISLREQGYDNAYVLSNGIYGYYHK